MAENKAQDATDALVQQALEEAKASVSQMQETADSATPAASADQAQGQAGDDGYPDESEAGAESPRGGTSGIELLSDVDLNVMIELGRTEMLVEDVLRLSEGSVVELDKLAGDPVDVHVNGRLIARGEVLVLNDQFCIRISEIVADLEEQAEAAAAQQQAEAATGV